MQGSVAQLQLHVHCALYLPTVEQYGACRRREKNKKGILLIFVVASCVFDPDPNEPKVFFRA